MRGCPLCLPPPGQRRGPGVSLTEIAHRYQTRSPRNMAGAKQSAPMSPSPAMCAVISDMIFFSCGSLC